MKSLGVVLICVGFIGGAFLASLDPREMNWSWFIPVLFVGFVGVYLLKRAAHAEARDEANLTGNIAILHQSLDNIVRELHELAGRKDELPTYEARFEIDKRFREHLTNFAEARESIRHVYGLKAYADIMSAFAAGERYINRVWSASTDGYVDEVKAYLDRARDQFDEAQEKFNQLQTGCPELAQG